MKTELDELRQQLAQIETDFLSRTDQLKDRISRLAASKDLSNKTLATTAQPNQLQKTEQSKQAQQLDKAPTPSKNKRTLLLTAAAS